MRQQLHSSSTSNAEASPESAGDKSRIPLKVANNPAGLLPIAEDTLAKLLSKATGTAFEVIPMPGMKPGLDSVGKFAISHNCSGVVARACGLVTLKMLSAGNGGTFGTLRYTITLENGSLVVCDRMLFGIGASPDASLASQFAGAEMLHHFPIRDIFSVHLLY